MFRSRRYRSRRPAGKRGKFRRYLKKTKKSALKKTIQKVLNKNLETKYVALELNSGYVYGNISGGFGTGGNTAAGNRMRNIIPTVPQTVGGAASVSAHTRVGNRISPVKMVTTIQYYFNGTGTIDQADLSGVESAGLYEVRQVVATPKAFRSNNGFDQLSVTDESGFLAKLLEVGNGTTSSANSAYPMNLNYPISNENWTAHTGNKKFIMGKNGGTFPKDGPNNYPLTNVRAVNTIRFTTKLPKVLIYDENVASGLPSNAMVMWGCYAGIVNNPTFGNSLNYDDLLQTVGITGAPAHPILRWNLRTELWFKDA